MTLLEIIAMPTTEKSMALIKFHINMLYWCLLFWHICRGE